MLKRRCSRSSQYLRERIDHTKATKVDAQFTSLRENVESFHVFIQKVRLSLKEYMQPNPQKRTTTAWKSSYLKVAGVQMKCAKYPQVELSLGKKLLDFSVGLHGLRQSTPYESSLKILGESFIELSECKDLMEGDVQDKFLSPLSAVQEEVEEVLEELKKFDKRRLEYDYNRNNQAKVTAINFQTSKYEYESSKRICYEKMLTLSGKESDHISLLSHLVSAVKVHHQKCGEVMSSCVANIGEMVKTAEGRENTLGKKVKMGTGGEVIDGRKIIDEDFEICEGLSDSENGSRCDDELTVDTNVVNASVQQDDTNIYFERINTAV